MSLGNVELDVAVDSDQWAKTFPDHGACIETCFNLILAHVPGAGCLVNFPHVELSILLTDDQNIQTLNRDYRGKDKATNVLSFPSHDADEIQGFLLKEGTPSGMPLVLGDIIFSWDTIAREAQTQGKVLKDHFCHLCLHGLLHLLGYDHVEDRAAEEMEALETALLAKLSIDDPYQA